MAAHDKATLRTAYLYLVCLVTLIMTIFAAVDVVRNVSRLAYPDPGYYGYEVAEKAGDETGEEVARQEERARESSRRQAVQSIVGSGAMLLVAVPVYLYHWRRVQEESSSARAGVQATGT